MAELGAKMELVDWVETWMFNAPKCQRSSDEAVYIAEPGGPEKLIFGDRPIPRRAPARSSSASGRRR